MELDVPLFEIKASEINPKIERSLEVFGKNTDTHHGCSILSTIMIDESAPNLFIEINTDNSYTFAIYTRNLPEIWHKMKSKPCLIRSYLQDKEYVKKYGAINENVGEKIAESSKYIYHIDIIDNSNYFEACFYKYGYPTYKKLSISLI